MGKLLFFWIVVMVSMFVAVNTKEVRLRWLLYDNKDIEMYELLRWGQRHKKQKIWYWCEWWRKWMNWVCFFFKFR